MVDYLERIGMGYRHDLWMVRVGTAFGQAQVFDGTDREWEREIERDTLPWLGFSHERVVPLISVSSTNDRLVIVHGDERGPSIVKMAALLADPDERMRWVVEQVAGIAEAIATMAWRQPGFIHRRANPEQIVVGADGTARLRAPVAFVKWGKTGSFTGQSNTFAKSIRFMAPEQVRGEHSSPATDVHGLAGTLYASLTGRAPFARVTEIDTLMAINEDVRPEPPRTAPPAVAALVMRGLARDPAQRPADPATFAADLRARMPEPLPPGLLAKVASVRPDTRPAPHASELIVGTRCPKRWDELSETPTHGIRHCEQCQHDVVQVHSLDALVPLLGARCVAFTPDDGN